MIVSAAGFGTVHYMERTEFCGQVCHTTMEPEFKAHKAWAHSEIACVGCHVGPGAGSFVESKIAGSRQLYHLLTNQVPKPVPTPVRSLGRTSDTCSGCHQLQRSFGDRPRVIRDFANDEANSETVTTLLMHVGSPAGKPGGGIHRHLALDIEYVTTDPKRETIPYVRVGGGSDGGKEFIAANVSPEQIAEGTRRRMDCTDCHNRPAHTMFFTAERAVDTAIAEGRIPRGLPFVRREAVAAVREKYGRQHDRARGDCEAARRVLCGAARFGPERGQAGDRVNAGSLVAQRVSGDERDVGDVSESSRSRRHAGLLPVPRR